MKNIAIIKKSHKTIVLKYNRNEKRSSNKNHCLQ